MSNKFKVLEHPNIWIADTGATVHTTPHRIYLVNKYKPDKYDNLTIVNGHEEGSKIIRDTNDTVCNKHGKDITAGRVYKVIWSPITKFNLISIPSVLEHKLTLGGDANYIWLEKNRLRFKFDIKIKIKKGTLFHLYIQWNIEISAGATTE